MKLAHKVLQWDEDAESPTTVWYWLSGAFRVSDYFNSKAEAIKARGSIRSQLI
ncbi:MAG TPA: hypothetical protein PK129_01915 [Cellvibrionaceae bacterium]|nr:hypothetical protein [Cellvibrionaceae bacterium]